MGTTTNILQLITQNGLRCAALNQDTQMSVYYVLLMLYRMIVKEQTSIFV